MGFSAVCILTLACLSYILCTYGRTKSQNPKMMGPLKLRDRMKIDKSFTVTSRFELDSTHVPAPNSSNETCALRISDDAFPIKLHNWLKSGFKLIFLQLEISDELSDDIKNKIVQPLTWTIASKNFGTNVLLLKGAFPLVVYRYIEIGVTEKTVTIKTKPTGCLLNLSASMFKRAILNILFDQISNISSTVLDHYICTLIMRPDGSGISSAADFTYKCYYKLKDNTIKPINLQSSPSMQILSNYYSIAILVLFLVLITYMIPDVLDTVEEYGIKVKFQSANALINEEPHSDEERRQLISTLTGSSCDLMLDKKANDFIAQDNSPISLRWLFIDNCVYCKQRDGKTFEKCCNVSPCPCVKSCKCWTWYSCLGSTVKTLILVTVIALFYLRIYIFFFIFSIKENEDKSLEDFAKKHNFSEVNKDIYELDMLKVVAYIVSSLFIVAVLIDIFWTGKFIEFVKGVNRDVAEFSSSHNDGKDYDDNDEDELDQSLKSDRRILECFYSPSSRLMTLFEKCGISAFLCLPLIIVYCFLQFLLRKSVSCLFVFTLCGRVSEKNTCKFLVLYSLFTLLYIVSLIVISDITSVFVSNFFFCAIVVLIDKSNYIVVVNFILAVVLYILDLFAVVKKRYMTFNSLICSYIRDQVIVKENISGPRIIFVKAKETLHARLKKNNKFRIKNAIPVIIDSKNRQSISHAFFLDAIEMNKKGVPGPLSENLLSTIFHFAFILLFLIFVMLVIVTFGDNFSDTQQIIVLLATNLIPHFVIKARKEKTLDLKDRDFQQEFRNIIDGHTEILYVQNESDESRKADILPGSIYTI